MPFVAYWAEIGYQNMSGGHYKKFSATFWYIYFFDTFNGLRVRASNLAQRHGTIKKQKEILKNEGLKSRMAAIFLVIDLEN